VELKILEMSRPEAYELISQAASIRSQMIEAGAYHGDIVDQFDKANESYQADKFGALKDSLSQMKDLRTEAFTAKERLSALREKISNAEKEEFNPVQTDRIYSLASSAFERGDYSGAIARVSEAELTYALETAQSFSIYSFVKKYYPQIVLAMLLVSVLSLVVFVDVRHWMMDHELSQLSNEENILLGLMKEAQSDYFDNGKMSTSEYVAAIGQYDSRLSSITERRVELETRKKNYFNFKSRSLKLKDEKARLEHLIGDLQKAYLEDGKVESRLYENRVKSYLARLSEVEETIAVEEAKVRLRQKKSAALGKAVPEKEEAQAGKKIVLPDGRKKGKAG
jgi:hypothetical protein